MPFRIGPDGFIANDDPGGGMLNRPRQTLEMALLDPAGRRALPGLAAPTLVAGLHARRVIDRAGAPVARGAFDGVIGAPSLLNLAPANPIGSAGRFLDRPPGTRISQGP